MGANTVCGTDARILRGKKTKGISHHLGAEVGGHVAEVGHNGGDYEEDVSGAVAADTPC